MWDALEDKGIRFLRGQLCLVCAAPGRGKSAFVLSYAVQAKVTTLYISADSDAFTQVTRMASMLTGWSMSKSMDAVRSEEMGDSIDLLGEVPIRFVYDASPTLSVIEDHLQAYLQTYGDYPACVVVDNITNIVLEGVEEGSAGLEGLMDYFHSMARNTGSCVIGLHHVLGEYNDGNKPIPLGGIKGQIGRVPELILTLYRIPNEFGPDTLFVCAVKARAGVSDSTGVDAAELEFHGETMDIRDFPRPLG